METKHKVYNLIILDESGSMQSIKKTIMNGFNEVVQTIKSVALEYPEQEHTVSFISFNSSGTKKIHENSKIELLNQIDERSYQPNGGTPLFDAMGASFFNLNWIIEKENPKNYNVLVTILTDGEENASKEHTAQSIKEIIETYKSKNWTFTYIGANHDVDLFASRISINNVMKFETNEEDMQRMFMRDRDARMNYSKKIRNFENVSRDYFEQNESDKEMPDDKEKQPEKKSFFKRLFGG
ncbi:MAG: VWA domain-containing protein [Sphingobacteriales bacterium]|nr:VWA domain-containing protein [Sphingobacteriales bacterium]